MSVQMLALFLSILLAAVAVMPMVLVLWLQSWS